MYVGPLTNNYIIIDQEMIPNLKTGQNIPRDLTIIFSFEVI